MGGGTATKTRDFTLILWPGSGQWQDVSEDVMESADVEVWKENARQYLNDLWARAGFGQAPKPSQ